MDLEPGDFQTYYVIGKDVSIDFEPGIQDVFFLKVGVPEGGQLVGFYEFKGSRSDYEVALGGIKPDGSVAWAPAVQANAKGRVYIDLNYDFDAEAGSYMIRVKMLPSSAGRMRVLLCNDSRIAVRVNDGDTMDDPGDLTIYSDNGVYHRFGDVSPEDWEDYYYFDSGDFELADGPKQFLRLKGAYAGMKMYLFRQDPAGTIGTAEITEPGGYATIDLDGIIVPNKRYLLAIARAQNVDEIQVYDLELRDDFYVMRPPDGIFKMEKMKLPIKKLKVKVKD